MMSRRSKTHAGSFLAASFVVVMMLAPGTAAASQLEVLSIARTPASAVGQESWRLLQATNQSRERFGLPPLRLNLELSAIARQHSIAMARAGSLFHTADVGIYLHAIDWRTWGENVGYTPGDVGSLHEAFMASPTHRENILDDAFRNVAIGSVRVDGTLWVTVFFYG
jgi:uncharacterized protein YkwD